MANVLAQQISRLLSLDAQSQREALNGLSTVCVTTPPAMAAPPGLPCPPLLRSAPGLECPVNLFSPAKSGINERISGVSTAIFSDASSLCSEPQSPPPNFNNQLFVGFEPMDSNTPRKISRCSTNLRRNESTKTCSTMDVGSNNDAGSDCSDPMPVENKENARNVSTLKIKNLPRRCTQEEILAAIEEVGFGGSYDFFFLPMGSQQRRQNRGYAFINFKDCATASRFRTAFQRYHIREKFVEVVVAPMQGLQQNLERYKNEHVVLDSHAVMV